MRKCKQVISMLLVLCMMFAVVSVGIVQGAAADKPQIYQDPPSEPALLGDVDRNGRVDGFDVLALKNSIAHNFAAGYLDYTKMAKNSIDFKVANCNKNDDGTEERIDGFDVFLLQQYIAHVPEARDKGIGEPVYPDPTEPPTQAPTDEDTRATITIYGLNDQSETREFNVGDTFNVYTSLNVKKAGSDIQIASASGDQTFSDPVLTLTSDIDNEQLFTDTDTVFPVFGDAAMGRLRGTGWVQYNASTPGINNGFIFDSDDDLVIVTNYTVTRGGIGEVRNALSYLAAADDDLTKLVTKGEVASDVELTVNATFSKPPHHAPPVVDPTEAPTEAPKPTEAPTEAPKPTEAPTEAPKPTEAPTEAPKPTEAPTEAPKPTEAPTEAPKPTEAPTEAPTQPQGKATVTVHGLDGKTETQEFNVGDTFTVYTTLNTSAYNNGRIGSINGRQLYTNAVLKLTDEYTEQDGILDVESMFPVTQYATMASGHHTDLADDDEYHDATRGGIFYNASIASYRGFAFDNNGAILIKSNYEVTAPGNADITNEMVTLAYSDEDLTRIIDRGVIVRDDFRLHASFLAPELQPTDAPTEAPKPTEAPTEVPEPTEAPTEAPVPTEAPTEPAPEDTYIVAGNATDIFGTSWNGNDANNTMTKGDDGIYTKQYTVDAAMKDVQLKAVKNGATWIGDETGNNVTFNLTGSGTFTVYCDGTKTWVDGDIVSYESGLDVQSVTAVGNGTYDGDGWLNNITWDPAAEANHMTKVSDGVYEIKFELGEYDPSDVEFKFAVNDAWIHNFGLGDNGVIANGVTTDAIYNGSTNLKITGLTAGTTIKMQLDLTGFDFDSKTGAKMTITWTAPAEPTEAPTEAPKPTEAPTEAPKPTEAPTEAPTQPQGKATVTVHGLDGKTETQEFNVGDTFTVYTTLNTSAYNNGRIGSINGRQLYTNAVLKLTDEYTEQEGILDLEAMFPVTQYATMASGNHTDLADDDEYHDATRGGIFYNASIASYRGFAFDNNGAILIKSNYEVTAPGNADITNEMVTLAYSDEELTRIIDRGVIVRNDFRLHASFLAPELQPTDAPTEAPKPTEAPTEAPKPTEAPTEAPKPTEAPTEAPKPTEAPTEAPKPTEAPTEAPTQPQGKATVTVHGLDGKTETQEFNVGDTFTVYTTLNTSAYNNGRIGSINGRQLYTNAVLKLTDEYTEQEGILDLESMFPVTQYATMASGHHTDLADDDEYHDATRGGIFYNASIASYRGFAFDNNGAILIKSNYEVTAPGNADITNEMVTLAYSDEELTRIIDRGVIVRNDFRLHASFLAPELQPTDAPTEAPKPTEAPTEAPKPTEAPTEAPKPTEAPTEAPKPTEAPTEAPKPTEAPTEAPTQPQGKATVTVHGLDGKTETQEFNVGDTFTVYTTLNTSAYNNGRIGSINGRQLYTNAVLKLTDEYTEQDGILDVESMFPITQYATMASGHHTDLADDDEYHDATRGGIFYNASIASYRGFAFDNNGAILIKSNYEVTAPGNADITNEMVTLAYSDEDLTRIIDRGVIVRNDFRLHASFLAPELQPTDAPVPTEAPKPTEAPTEAPKPTEAPTEAPKPTEAPTEAPKPTEAPTEAPKPTEAPTEAPKPTEAPTEAPKPTEAPTEAPKPTEAPTEPSSRTIIFSNNKGFSEVNIYYWSEEDQPVDWPGVPMTYYDTNEMGEKRYTIELPAGMTNYIINDGGSQQTVDIDFTGSTGVYLTDKNSSGNYEVAFYDIGGDTNPTTAPTTAPQPTTPTPSVADGYYLVGTMTDWKADAAYKFSENTANPGEYMLSTTLAATDGIKAVKVENGAITTWYPDGMDNEYTVDAAHAGDVTIYFKTTYQSDWSTFGGYLYIDGGSAPTPDPTTAPTEAPDVTDRTIIFSNNKGFGTVNIYYWSEEDQPVDWPGVPMTYLDTNEMGEKRYTIELPAGMTNYVINDGGTQQTVDIDFTGATGVYMTDKDSSGNYAVAFYDIGGTDPTPDPTTAPQPTTPTPTEATKNYVYLNAGGSILWDQANARFKLYVWNDDGEKWLTGTAVNGKYQFEVPAGYTDGIFVRMDPAKTADDWDSVWNQTGDLTLQIGKTYTITSWTGGDNGHSGGSWS